MELLVVSNLGKFDFLKTSDLNFPIALRKGVRSCASHPIFDFVSLHRLSPSFHVFTSHLSYDSVLKNIQEVVTILEWKNAVFEET